MKEKTSTIYSIADELGVSPSTVSRAISCPEKVAEKTLIRIQEAMAQHNYVPNGMARGLAKQSSIRSVGLIVPNLSYLFFSSAAEIIINTLFEYGYTTFLCNSGTSIEKLEQNIRILSEKQVDGLIFLGSWFSDKNLAALMRKYLHKKPFVTSGSELDEAYSVFVDYNNGLDIAVRHLCEKGHREICLVDTIWRHSKTSRKRKGFAQAYVENKLLGDPDAHILNLEFGLEEAYYFARAVKAEQYSAYIFLDDMGARGAVNGFQERGMRVPEDVSVIGFDNSVFSVCATPKLTVIDTKTELVAKRLAMTMIDLLQDRTVQRQQVVKPELIIRESS